MHVPSQRLFVRMTTSLRTRLSTLAKAVLAVLVVGALVLYVDPQAMAATIRAANPWLLALSVAMVIPNLWGNARAWAALMSPLMPQMERRTLWRAVLAGFAVGFFTPARIGEYAGRAFSVAYPNKWSVTATVLLQRLIDLVIGLWVGTVVLAYVWHTGWLPREVGWGIGWGVVLIGGIAFAVVVTAGLLAPRTMLRLAKKLPSRWMAWGTHLSFLNRLSKRATVLAFGWSAMRYGVFIAQMAVLVIAFDASVALGPALAGAALAYYIRYLIPSITLMDLGMREGAAVFFLPFFGADPAAALNAALVVFALNIAAPSLVGAVFLRGLSFTHDTVPVQQAVPSPSSDSPPPAA